MEFSNHEEVIKWIEKTTHRILTEDEKILVGIGFDFGTIKGREEEEEKNKRGELIK
jgi:hypothetical protein